MGGLMSAFKYRWRRLRSVPVEHPPIFYGRPQDYTADGRIRRGIQGIWNLAMKSLIITELELRKALYPAIQKRMKNFVATRNYRHFKVDEILESFGEWNRPTVYDYHDLFQVFEAEGNGLVEIQSMSDVLDRMGDSTPVSERLELFCSVDVDSTGSIDFSEFLHIIYELDIRRKGLHPLCITFSRLQAQIQTLRNMSSVQLVKNRLV